MVASSEDDVEALHVLGRFQTGPLLVDPSTALAQLVVWVLWSAVRSRDFAGCSELRSVVVGCTLAADSVHESVRRVRFCLVVRPLTALAQACRGAS